MTLPKTVWGRAEQVLACFAADPTGLGGIWVRARHGPVRTAFRKALRDLTEPITTIHPGIDDRSLFGGLDLAAVLRSGEVRHADGLIKRARIFELTMAERATPEFAARLTGLMDAATHAVIALDEGADAEEIPPPALTERMAFFIDLDGLSIRDTGPLDVSRGGEDAEISPEQVEDLAVAAMSLAITSLRPVQFAARTARLLAAFDGRDAVAVQDLSRAAGLVFAHRAQTVAVPEPEAPDQPPERTDDTPASKQDNDISEQDLMIEAAQAAIPDDLLAQLNEGRKRRVRSAAAGSGQRQRHNRRGRPKPSQPGPLVQGAQLDLVATLRTAAPWQRLRCKPPGCQLAIRPSDFRLKRYENKSDRLLIFAVDASGSAALARLAEAKGTVELLLGQAYARRDYVALIGFRKTTADLLLPPTRSLVQTRKRLSALPGGGGTPLAAGLQTAQEEGRQAARKGMTPTLILLTDGRANVALDGTGNRSAATADAERMARGISEDGLTAMVIDTAARQSSTLRTLAAEMNALYLPLPRADAHRMSGAVARALND